MDKDKTFKYTIITFIITVISFAIMFKISNKELEVKRNNALRKSQELVKIIPKDTNFILIESTMTCPDGYAERLNLGEGKNFTIPAGTFVVGYGNPDPIGKTLTYKLCGLTPPLPVVK